MLLNLSFNSSSFVHYIYLFYVHGCMCGCTCPQEIRGQLVTVCFLLGNHILIVWLDDKHLYPLSHLSRSEMGVLCLCFSDMKLDIAGVNECLVCSQHSVTSRKYKKILSHPHCMIVACLLPLNDFTEALHKCMAFMFS